VPGWGDFIKTCGTNFSTVETAVDIEQLLKDIAGKLNPILCNEFGDEIWGLFQMSVI
jgi:hypothetical protein